MRMIINESNLTLALNWVNKAVTINSAVRDIDGAIACYQKVVDLLQSCKRGLGAHASDIRRMPNRLPN